MNKLMRSTKWLAGLALFALIFMAGCGGDDNGGTTPTNHNPQILAVTVNPASVVGGGTVTVTVTATDADGDALTYTYQPSGGSIVGSTATVSWTAPVTAGTVSVLVTVNDGNGGTATSSASLTVTAQATGITGTITAPAGIQVDLRNMQIRLYDSVAAYLADAPFLTATAQGTEYSVSFSFMGIVVGTFFVDGWKDMDNSGTYTVGDVWTVYATGQWPNWTVAPVMVTQGNVTNCSSGMITFLL
jgi:hypothetical protein